MADDHKARMAEINYWADVTESLIKKLEDRDAEIARLRRLLEIQEIAERL